MYISTDKDLASAKESLEGALFPAARAILRLRPLTHFGQANNRSVLQARALHTSPTLEIFQLDIIEAMTR
jgi:hypothetical protein